MSEQAAKGTEGLNTDAALQSLHSELSALVEEHKRALKRCKWRHFLSLMQERSSIFTLSACVCVIVMGISLLVSAAINKDTRAASGSQQWVIFEGLFLLMSAALNCGLHLLRLRGKFYKHVNLKSEYLQLLKAAYENGGWNGKSYPSTHTPISPCISLQWVMRDGNLVNLPHPLLVKDDLIVMRPGQPAPGRCKAVEDDLELVEGEIVCFPTSETKGDGPQPRVPMSAKKFVLLETPAAKNFRCILQDDTERPYSLLDNERHAVTSVWIGKRFWPVLFIVFLAVNLLRFLHLDTKGGHWTEVLIVLQVHGMLPLVPIALPGLWFLVNLCGQEYIFGAYRKFCSSQDVKDSSESLSSGSAMSVEDTQSSICWKDLLTSVWQSILGNKGSVCPDFEMLHVLGSVTALCCVDKKGILSWPNPSAEKVFFFSSAPNSVPVEEDFSEEKPEKGDKRRKKRSRQESDCEARLSLEVLDVTHDTAKDAFSLVFDDPNWKNHLSALKPLGLDILLNTCNDDTSPWYTQFTDHVACAARQNKDTVAVVSRRCLCSLSKEMGFTEDAVKIFNQEATLGVYRQVPAEEAEREKQNRARSFIQHKIPMPNQVSVVVRDKLTGQGQLMTQGTGDLVLDCCTDAWTGSDLHLLSELDRKRVLDFYHRNSMVAYCTAFAYKPLPRTMLDWPDNFYTELMESPNTTKVSHGEDMGVFLDGEDDEIMQRQRSHSVDSLLEMSPTSSVEELGVGQMLQSHQTFLGMISLQYQARQDFVQLITKLETACIKFVHFSKENEVRSRVFAEKMGLEAGWNCHVSLIASSEPVSSANSSSRNLSSLGQHPPGEPGGGDVGAVGGDKAGGVTGDNDGAQLATGSPSTMQRVQSAPCVVNIEGTQVKFAKDPPSVVYDDDTAALLGQRSKEATANSSSDRQMESTLSESYDGEGERSVTETTALLSSEAASQTRTVLPTACPSLDPSSDYDSSRHLYTNPRVDAEMRWGMSSLVEDSNEQDGDKSDGADGDAEDDSDDDEEEDYDIHSDSKYTSSYVTENTEDSLTGVFDNRARLPRGIDNIRPHLKNVDNVPLLVNLFTDCVPEATKEMIKIMQENGEVVLVIGSSLNMDNTNIFMQANCSIAIEPLYPQLCSRRSVKVQPWNEEDISPTQLASRMLSLPCSLFYQRKDHIRLVELIMESRHFILAMRNSFHLMLCCMLALTLSQLLSCMLMFPPPLSPQHILWLVCVILPALSISLMGNPNEARTLTLATHKNINLVGKQKVLEFMLQFSVRFMPSILVALVCYALVLYSFCDSRRSRVDDCSLYNWPPSASWNNSGSGVSWSRKFQGGLVLAQNIFHLYFTIFLVAVSVSIVHWQDHLWQKLPVRNLMWSATVASIMLLQVIFTVSDVLARHDIWGSPLPLSDVNLAVWILGCVWPFVAIGLNELVKKREIKLALRAQKRARLDFDTKLGMNSPF